MYPNLHATISNIKKIPLDYWRRLTNAHSPQAKKKQAPKSSSRTTPSPLRSALKRSTSNTNPPPVKILRAVSDREDRIARYSPGPDSDDEDALIKKTKAVTFAGFDKANQRPIPIEYERTTSLSARLAQPIRILSTLIGIALLLGGIVILILALSHPHALALLFGASVLTASGILAVKIASSVALSTGVITCAGICFFKPNHSPKNDSAVPFVNDQEECSGLDEQSTLSV